jgi:Ni/Fe-hydrogenase 1 B-type cytochrome subunit
MRADPVTGEVLQGPLEPVYVYEAPVRLAHWVFVIAITVLAITGFLIGDPISIQQGEATNSFFFGWIRTIHFIAGYVLAIMFVVRLYWVFVGNKSARSIFIPPFWSPRWWKGVFGQAGYYLFVGKDRLWVGHNPLAQAAMFFMFTLGVIFMIFTGFALYAEQWGWGLTPMNLFGWQFVLLEQPQMVRTLHHLGMWYILLFVMVHVYMVFREDIMSGESVIGTMINGIRMWKHKVKAH